MRRRAAITFAFMALLLSAIPLASAAPREQALMIPEWEALWSGVLTRYVDDAGRVDFAALARDHGDLDRVVAFVAAINPVSRPQLFPDRASRLAYSVNAHNALATDGIIESGIPMSLGGLAKFTFFYLRKFTVGGRSISLYDLENDVIRPLGDKRVHFALNCMVVSCPRLPRTAFTARALESRLDKAARTFVAEKRNVSVDPVRHEVWLSAIFDFYTTDVLAHAPTLIGYVNRYRTEPIPIDFRVRFFDYDWTVNDRGRVALKGSVR